MLKNFNHRDVPVTIRTFYPLEPGDSFEPHCHSGVDAWDLAAIYEIPDFLPLEKALRDCRGITPLALQPLEAILVAARPNASPLMRQFFRFDCRRAVIARQALWID